MKKPPNEIEQELNILLEIRDAMDEAERRIKAQIQAAPYKLYVPIKPEECQFGDSQLKFHQSVSKVKVASGGERSSKTFICANELVWHITGDYPDYFPEIRRLPTLADGTRPYHWVVYSATVQTHLEGPWNKLKELLPASFLPRMEINSQSLLDEPMEFPNRFKISLKTYGQGKLAHTGWSVNGIWYDEPPPTHELFLKGVRGSLDKRGVVMLSATPLECEWMEEELLSRATRDPEEIYVTFVAYLDVRDNKYLPEEERKFWVNFLGDGDKSAMHLGGKSMAQLLGIYRDEDIAGRIIDELPEGYKLDEAKFLMALDPHDGKPPCMVWWALWDRDKESNLNPIIQIEEDYMEDLIIDTMAARIKEIEEGYKIKRPMRIIDPNFSAKRYANTGKTYIQELREAMNKYGIMGSFKYPNDNVALRHNAVKTLLRNKLADGSYQLKILRKCRGTIAGFRGYRRKKWDTAAIVDNKHKDFMDAFGYLAVAGRADFESATQQEVEPVRKEDFKNPVREKLRNLTKRKKEYNLRIGRLV